jgi:hypothetical protein
LSVREFPLASTGTVDGGDCSTVSVKVAFSAPLGAGKLIVPLGTSEVAGSVREKAELVCRPLLHEADPGKAGTALVPPHCARKTPATAKVAARQ